jgi:hypothetical protein
MPPWVRWVALAAACACVVGEPGLAWKEKLERISSHTLHRKALLQSLKRGGATPAPRAVRTNCDASGRCTELGLRAHIHGGSGTVTFCRDCDPEVQGSFAGVWRSAFSPSSFDVTGEVVYAVPNDASSDILVPIRGAIALIDRGVVAIAEKARRAVEAGAVAAIIVDVTGECDEDFRCGGVLGERSPHGPGFAAADDRSAWEGVTIPVVLVTKRTGTRLLSLLESQERHVPGLGLQTFHD